MDNLSTYGNTFVNKKGSTDNSTLKTAKLIGVYFSAHWCPPCRNFTPVLAKFYDDVNKNGHVFEVIFSSSDQDEKSFKEYLNTMPWIALPLGDPKCDTLSGQFKVSGIPRLVILDQTGKVVVDNARNDVMRGVVAWDKWTGNEVPKPQIDSSVWDDIKSGKPVRHKDHPHDLKYVNYEGKSEVYASGPWGCDICGVTGDPSTKNLHCSLCSFDCCDSCLEL